MGSEQKDERGSVSASDRGVAIGGAAEGNTIVTGDSNVVGGQSVQTGGIRARTIKADNVVEGVQMQGGDAQTAASLVELARAIQRGGIQAGSIEARNVVAGLQYIADPTTASADDLRKEIGALRAQLEQAIQAGEIANRADAEDAQEALSRAESELAALAPQGNRVVRRLDELTTILTKSAEAVQAAGKVGALVIKLAPLAAVALQVAQRLFGG